MTKYDEDMPEEFIGKQGERNPEDMPEPFVSQAEDENKAEPAKKSRAAELLEQIYTTRTPRPRVDQASLDRLQRIGRLNNIGQGINVLGDMFALAKGANVRQRGPDQTAPAIYEAYQRAIDRGKDAQDRADLMDFKIKRENLQTEYAGELKKEYQDKMLEAARDKNQTDWNKYLKGLDLSERKAAEAARHNLEMEKSARIRANKAGGKPDKEDKPVTIKTTSGKTYTLKPEDAALIRDEAIQKQDLLQKKYPSWFVETPILDAYNQPTGQSKVRLDTRIKDDQLQRAVLELREEEEVNRPAMEKEARNKYAVESQMEDYINDSVKAKPAVKIDYSKLNF